MEPLHEYDDELYFDELSVADSNMPERIIQCSR